MVMGDYGDDIDEYDDDDDDEEDDEDRSLDLLIKFVENVFKKVSRKARRAVKSVLPVPISTRLVTIVHLQIRLQFRSSYCVQIGRLSAFIFGLQWKMTNASKGFNYWSSKSSNFRLE